MEKRITDKYPCATAVNLSVPFSYPLCPRHALIPGAVTAPLLSLVPAILHICDDTEICLSIIQAVMIYMVDEFIIRDGKNLTMHSYFFSSAVLCRDHAYGIKAPPAAHCEPFIFRQPFVIGRVDNREFSLGERNPHEGVAVAETAVT